MKAVITVGISASGKSTYAEALVKQGYSEINRDWIRFNVVSPGKNWSNYKFNGNNEKQVTEIQGKMIMEACGNEQNIVISDTNLNAKRRRALMAKLQDIGYDVEVVGFPITREEAVKRDNLRANGVGQDVIYRQNIEWQDYIGRKIYIPDETKPKAIIVDVDGTIAEMGGRGPFEWHRVGEDAPRKFVIEMVKSYYELGYEVIVCSGRSAECSELTATWLDENIGSGIWGHLYMRKVNDYRKDNSVKEEIFWTHIADRYNVVAAIDDRPQMIRLWHEIKIPNVIAVADPYIEF